MRVVPLVLSLMLVACGHDLHLIDDATTGGSDASTPIDAGVDAPPHSDASIDASTVDAAPQVTGSIISIGASATSATFQVLDQRLEVAPQICDATRNLCVLGGILP